jgi:DNA-directed RNA polymerase specialized sigma24 family protein
LTDVPFLVPSDRQRPPRLRPIAPGTISDNVRASEGVSDQELVARLYEALAGLPPAERAAAVVAFGLGEGHEGVADELGLATDDADALTRSALQLLRTALGDVDLDDPVFYSRLERRRGHRTARPSAAPDA